MGCDSITVSCNKNKPKSEASHMSSVKWSHLGHIEPNSIKTIFSTKILWGHLDHFEPDQVTAIIKSQNKN